MIERPQVSRPVAGARLGWWCLLAGLLGLVVAYAAAVTGRGTSWAAVLLALAVPTATAGLTILAIGPRARMALRVMLVVVHAVVAGGLALAVPGPFALMGSIGPAPRATVVVLLAVGVVPLLLLPVLYAVTFSEDQLSASTLTRIREARRRA
ncbi:MAG: hypothetical protein RLZZ621_2050 [Gemmatimonadota bacterium]